MITNNKSSSVFILTTMLDYLYRYFTMFKKNKKRPEISKPLNFEHRVHTGFDPEHGKYVGLPPQWMGIIIPDQQIEWRKPVVDPSTITDMDIQPLKVPLNINFLLFPQKTAKSYLHVYKRYPSKFIISYFLPR